jgi:hypothetical protein
MVGYRLASFFGKADYNYNDLILASFTLLMTARRGFGRNIVGVIFPAASLVFVFRSCSVRNELTT